MGINFNDRFKELQQDAFLWKAGIIMATAKNPGDKAEAIDTVSRMILSVQSTTLQSTYITEIEANHKLKRNIISKTVDTLKKMAKPADLFNGDEESEEEGIINNHGSKLPKWVSRDDEMQWRRNGYFPCAKDVGDQKRVGFYSISVKQTEAGPAYNTIEITNFVVNPIMHVYKGDDSRHIIEIYNGYVKAVKEIPSKSIPSREQVQAIAVTEGSFAIFGNNLQWLRIASDLLKKFPRCEELEDLGYHPAGFFCYSDYIFKPGSGRIEVSKYGILEVGDKKYLLPQQSDAYANLSGTGGDPYENDRVLTYKQSPVTFDKWAEMVYKVYDVKGVVGVAFCIFTLFRDIVAKVTGTSPHLYLFGPPQSGKSVLAKMIYSLFYVNRNFFIAYEGTVPAFYTYLTRFINCPAVINEVGIETTEPERLQAFKGAFDLEGREKMKIGNGTVGNKRSTTIQRINSSLILVGQHVITTDDNALLTRSIMEDFLPNDNRTIQQITAFDELDSLGKKGITSLLCDLLKMREEFENNFRSVYLDNISEWIKQTSAKGSPLVQRIMNNYSIIYACYRILSKFYTLPITHEEFNAYCLERARHWSRFVSSSDSLSEFWRYISYLFEAGIIIDGWDIKVENVTKLKTRENKEYVYESGEDVIFIRLNNVHKVYQAEHRKRTGKDGISMENLLHYFKAKPYYIGSISNRRFRRFRDTVQQMGPVLDPHRKLVAEETNSSCYAFQYSGIEKSVEGFNLLKADTEPEKPDHSNQWKENKDWE